MRSSSGVIIFKESSVLMQLRDNIPTIAFPNTWCFPGGGIESGEKPKQAAIREIEEETGYIIKPKKIYRFLSGTMDFSGHLAKAYVYINEFDKTQNIQCLEGQKMEFIEIDEIKKIENINEYIKTMIIEAHKVYSALKKEGYFN